MYNNLIKFNNGSLISIYFEHGSLFECSYLSNKWETPKKILGNILENFSIFVNTNNTIFIFCQNNLGDVLLLSNSSGLWVSNTMLLHPKKEKVIPVTFFKVPSNDNFSVLYCLPFENSYKIMKQGISKNGTWSKPIFIDYCTPLKYQHLHIVNISKNHNLLCYKIKTNLTSIGYREFNNNKFGNFLSFLDTPFTIVDTSFLLANNTLHNLSITSSNLSTQLTYRQKHGGSFSNPLVLFEGKSFNKCSLFIINDTIYCSFVFLDHIYFFTSTDNGLTFSQINKHPHHFSNITKINFINEYSNDTFISNELYSDFYNPSNIYFITDLYPDFFKHNLINIASIVNDSKLSTINNLKLENKKLLSEIKALKKNKNNR